jgi:hypothetical protein
MDALMKAACLIDKEIGELGRLDKHQMEKNLKECFGL